MFCYICRLLVVRWYVEEYFKAHSIDYRKSLGISHWEPLVHMKKLLEWPMYASLNLEPDKHVTVGKTLKRLTKLMDRLHGIRLGYDEGMESRTVMVPANGMVYKLREELKNDGALLFGSYSWHTWIMEVSIFAYYIPCSLLCVLHIFALYCL